MRFPDDVPVLVDGDVMLRAPRLDDAAAAVEQCVDPESIRFTTVPLGYTLAMAEEFVTTSAAETWANGSRLFAIECTHPDGVRRFAGSLKLRDEGSRRAEIAFGAHPAVRGRGVMTTAVRLLLGYGFDECDLETVIWYANVGNFASRRVAWKTGFRFAGTLRRWLPQRGEYIDAWAATLHRDDPREPQTTWLDVPTIHGQDVVLRPLRDSDVPRIVEACRDSRTQYWLAGLPDNYRDDDARAYIERCRLGAADGEMLQFAIADPASDLLIGAVGLPRLSAPWAEIGYWAHPEARGRGVMTAATALITRHGFIDIDDGGLGLHRLVIRASTENAASQQVAIANGFTRTGVERQAERLGDGRITDLVTFELLRDEWIARPDDTMT